MTKSDFDDFSKYFKPEPNLTYRVVVTEWKKIYDTYKGEQKPAINMKVLIVNGVPLEKPKEFNTTAASIALPLMDYILKAQEEGFNALEFSIFKSGDNKYKVSGIELRKIRRAADHIDTGVY
jgi:hypothetical protein